MSNWYVGYKKADEKKYTAKHIYLEQDGKKEKYKEVFWGDFLNVVDDSDADWLKIQWGDKNAFFKRKDAVTERPLEIIFVDVGQGDGAVLITPEKDESEAIIVIDAGEEDMMSKFLEGRFGKYMKKMDFHAAIMTHCDEDHYGGFEELLDIAGFKNVYHNGLVERTEKQKTKNNGRKKLRSQNERIGKVEGDFITDFPTTHKAFKEFFSDKNPTGVFAKFAEKMLKKPRWGTTKFLARNSEPSKSNRKWLPEFKPEDNRGYTIEVLGPIVTKGSNGKKYLPRFDSSYGMTKNGNSILLRLEYGDFSVFFGGDLNKPAEEYLLAQYSGRSQVPEIDKSGQIQNEEALEAEFNAMSLAAAPHFSSSIMKACHHGSADVTDAFIQAVNPSAFVISSGDNEGHVHPRPDLLGRLGKAAKGVAPVILSTELQRGSRTDDDYKDAEKLLKKLKKLKLDDKGNLPKDVTSLVGRLARSNVQVYGAIYLKTDGKRLITAFKKETDSLTKRWFHFEYRLTKKGMEPVASGSH